MLSSSVLSDNLPPLAQRIRPQRLEDFIGQKYLLHDKSLLIQSILENQPFSLIFWGPPGSGKTTLVRILSNEFNIEFHEISAVSSGVNKIREILEKGKMAFNSGKKSILFIDEIHRFSKSQQDVLLHSIENGTIILMGATTENPSFEVITPLLSRCQVLKLDYLDRMDLRMVINRALKEDILLSKRNIKMSDDVKSYMIESCGGDTRKMLNTLELSVSMIPKDEMELKVDYVQEAFQNRNVIYDKGGDYHYDVISAYIKSVRGSDPDAAIYWLAVMLEGGEKPEFIARRLIILASEDIGNAEPYSLQLANAAFDAVNKIGLPESRIILAQITTYLSAAPKSNAAYKAINSAIKLVEKEGAASVPMHLRNSPTKMMKEIGFGKNYKYSHDYDNHFIKQNYFPETFVEPPVFYYPEDEGREKFIKERLEKFWKERYK